MELIQITEYCLIAIVCWVIVGLAATYAIFSKRINDTLFERIALSCVGFSSFSIVWYLAHHRWISVAGFSLSVSFGLYVVSVTWKHWRRYAKGQPPEGEH